MPLLITSPTDFYPPKNIRGMKQCKRLMVRMICTIEYHATETITNCRIWNVHPAEIWRVCWCPYHEKDSHCFLFVSWIVSSKEENLRKFWVFSLKPSLDHIIHVVFIEPKYLSTFRMTQIKLFLDWDEHRASFDVELRQGNHCNHPGLFILIEIRHRFSAFS